MADYGHELAFGTFLTPQNQRPEDVVALAQLTEQAGLDFATFQDHPYQSAFLDTWTLMTWVLSSTTTLRVAPNVLEPAAAPAGGGRALRGVAGPAVGRAVRARARRGRVLGRDRGDGRPRLTPGEAVDGLSEAIDVIRALWDVSTRRGGAGRGLAAPRGRAPSAGRSRRTTWSSGSAPTSRGCCG